MMQWFAWTTLTHLHGENDHRKAQAEFHATLRHDGILILDQRNYDALLDHRIEFGCNYWGDSVLVIPEQMNEFLLRLRCESPGNQVFHLDLFPLRKLYVRRLLREVGFQRITTYGDFQEIYRHREPDFFIHVAEKSIPQKA